jgi:hypothetical protein
MALGAVGMASSWRDLLSPEAMVKWGYYSGCGAHSSGSGAYSVATPVMGMVVL